MRVHVALLGTRLWLGAWKRIAHTEVFRHHAPLARLAARRTVVDGEWVWAGWSFLAVLRTHMSCGATTVGARVSRTWEARTCRAWALPATEVGVGCPTAARHLDMVRVCHQRPLPKMSRSSCVGAPAREMRGLVGLSSMSGRITIVVIVGPLVFFIPFTASKAVVGRQRDEQAIIALENASSVAAGSAVRTPLAKARRALHDVTRDGSHADCSLALRASSYFLSASRSAANCALCSAAVRWMRGLVWPRARRIMKTTM